MRSILRIRTAGAGLEIYDRERKALPDFIGRSAPAHGHFPETHIVPDSKACVPKSVCFGTTPPGSGLPAVNVRDTKEACGAAQDCSRSQA